MKSSALNKIMAQVAEFSSGRLALVGALLAGLYYSTVFDDGSMLRQSIESIKVQIQEEKIKKIETTRILQKEEQMRADVTMLVRKYEEVKSKIPIEFLESELRIIINQFATQFDIQTTKNERATKTKNFESQEDAKLIDQIVLDYTFVGTFFNIEKFLLQIANMDKLVKAESFIISSSGQRDKEGVSRKITLNATLIGFKQSMLSLNENKLDGRK
jgi:hypothetical protein